jgi:endonuclease/exonuclease/phosphatase family metal-dependent hydrolase
MKTFFVLLAAFLITPSAKAFEVFNLNVFDQLQGEWDSGFRGRRLKAVTDYVKKRRPDLVVFQEATGELPGEKKGGKDSPDGQALAKLYPHRVYIHEMTGKDNASYGYWMGSKKKPEQWIEDGFSFPGGVERRVQGAVFGKGKSCLGVLSLHLSYQTSEVRVKEAHWLLDWLKGKESVCSRWLVLGDFNADADSAEMKTLFEGGLKNLFKEAKPTIGAFNPIRQIYGKDIPSKTIDWALGWNINADAEVVLDSAQKGDVWVSDHAAVYVKVKQGDKK